MKVPFAPFQPMNALTMGSNPVVRCKDPPIELMEEFVSYKKAFEIRALESAVIQLIYVLQTPLPVTIVATVTILAPLTTTPALLPKPNLEPVENDALGLLIAVPRKKIGPFPRTIAAVIKSRLEVASRMDKCSVLYPLMHVTIFPCG